MTSHLNWSPEILKSLPEIEPGPFYYPTFNSSLRVMDGSTDSKHLENKTAMKGLVTYTGGAGSLADQGKSSNKKIMLIEVNSVNTEL